MLMMMEIFCLFFSFFGKASEKQKICKAEEEKQGEGQEQASSQAAAVGNLQGKM